MAWALSQHAINAAFASASTASKSFAANPTSGNLLVAMLFVNNATATFPNAPTGASITGSWVPLAGSGVNSAGAAQSFQAWGAINNATTTASSISISWTGAGTGDFVIAEFSGITGSVVQDGSVVTATGTAATVTTPSFTPTVTGSLLIQTAITSTGVLTASGGSPAWTQVDTQTQFTGTSDGWGWQTGSLSAVPANLTMNGTPSWSSIIFGIQAGGAANLTQNMPAKMATRSY